MIRHAHATHATVDVAATGGRLAVVISDDGTGFDVTQPYPGHLGLATMRERAEALGGELSVNAASERGTTVRVIVDAPASAVSDRDG